METVIGGRRRRRGGGGVRRRRDGGGVVGGGLLRSAAVSAGEPQAFVCSPEAADGRFWHRCEHIRSGARICYCPRNWQKRPAIAVESKESGGESSIKSCSFLNIGSCDPGVFT